MVNHLRFSNRIGLLGRLSRGSEFNERRMLFRIVVELKFNNGSSY